MDAALFLLKFRGRSRREMAERLVKKGFSVEAAKKTVERLCDLGLINDEKLAADMADVRRKTGRGDRRIRRDLWRRGLPRDIIDKSLAELPADESSRAWDALVRRAGRIKNVDNKTLYRRLAGFLGQQGFSPDKIQEALEKYFSNMSHETFD